MIYRRCHNATCASQLKASLLWSPGDFWFFWYFSYRLNFRNPPSGTWSHEILGGLVKYRIYRYLTISHHVLLVPRVTICYHHNFRYASVSCHILLMLPVLLQSIWPPPKLGWSGNDWKTFFFRNGFPPVSAVLDVHPRGYQLAIICTHIRHNALYNL